MGRSCFWQLSDLGDGCSTSRLEESAFGCPAIADGRLHIRDLETMWAFEVKVR